MCYVLCLILNNPMNNRLSLIATQRLNEWLDELTRIATPEGRRMSYITINLATNKKETRIDEPTTNCSILSLIKFTIYFSMFRTSNRWITEHVFLSTLIIQVSNWRFSIYIFHFNCLNNINSNNSNKKVKQIWEYFGFT